MKQHKRDQRIEIHTDIPPTDYSLITKRLQILFLCVALLILVTERIYPYRAFYTADTIVLRDPDSCYHARRIFYIATHNLQLPFYDPLLLHPSGAIPIWSPLYDWIFAVPSFLLGYGHPSQKLVLLSAMHLNVLFGLLQLFFIGLLIYRATRNYSLGILSGFLVGIQSTHVRYSTLEIIDHEALFMLLFCIILLKLYVLLNKDAESPSLFFLQKTFSKSSKPLCLSKI